LAQQLQESLDLGRGPLLRVGRLRLGEGGGGRLVVVIHHLAVDGVSWRVLLEDLQRGYEQAAAGQEVELGAKTSSYRQWAERLEEYAQSAAVAEERAYWEEEARRQVAAVQVDHEA